MNLLATVSPSSPGRRAPIQLRPRRCMLIRDLLVAVGMEQPNGCRGGPTPAKARSRQPRICPTRGGVHTLIVISISPQPRSSSRVYGIALAAAGDAALV